MWKYDSLSGRSCYEPISIMILPLTFINKLLPFSLCWYMPVFTHIFGHNIILRISCYILGRVRIAIRDLWPVVECSPGIASSRFLDVLIKRNGIVMKFFYWLYSLVPGRSTEVISSCSFLYRSLALMFPSLSFNGLLKLLVAHFTDRPKSTYP